MANDVINSTANRSIDSEVRGLLNLAANLEALGVREAVTKAGVRYVGDAETGEAIIAARDVIVTKSRATIGIMIALPSASPDEVLADLNGFTQQLRGAVVGRSQSWVSARSGD